MSEVQASASAAHTHTTPWRRPDERRGSILIVDDDEFIGTTLMRLLERNFDVAMTTRSAQARDWLLRGDRYDVILCDLLMPQLSGMDLHEQLAIAAPDQANRMIFLTGGSLNTDVRNFLDRVPNPRLEKPFELASLLTLIKARLHSPVSH